MMKTRRMIIAAIIITLLLSLIMSSTAFANAPEKVSVLIGFDHQPGPSEQALIHQAGGTIKYTYNIIPAMAVTLPEVAVAALQANPHVTYVEPDGIAYAIDSELDSSWGVKKIGAGTVHESGNKGASVKVAVIDTGIDYTHPDLDANCVPGGYDFANNDNDPKDDHGHGTHVAGIIGAEDDGSGVVGVAPEADLYAVKVLNRRGSGSWSNIAAGIDWAVDKLDVQIINMSLGGTSFSQTLKNACDAAEGKGVLVVAAAGNEGNSSGTGDSVLYPARFASVMSVAATDKNDDRAYFSSTGPAVEIAAPGVSVRSTYLNHGYTSMSGTSMASPHVAGTAALIMAAHPTWSNEEVRIQLQQTADDLGDEGRDEWYGFGLVDAVEAVQLGIGDPPTVTITSPADGSSYHTNNSITFTGTATDAEDVNLASSLEWASSEDGHLGDGASISTTLSEGTHTITASVTDSDGNTSEDSIVVTVVNDAPVITIYEPTDTVFESGAIIHFSGSAGDTEDGDVSSSLVWSSSNGGWIGTGPSISVPLSDGPHTITAEVTDSGGKIGTASITITVGTPSAPTEVSALITYGTVGGKAGDKHLLITVALSEPIANAAITITILHNGTYSNLTGTTGLDGTVTFKIPNAPAGLYTTSIEDVVIAGEDFSWNGVTLGENTFTK